MTRTTNQMTDRQGRWTRPLWRMGCVAALLCGALGAVSPSQTTLAATVGPVSSLTLTQSAATTVAGQPVTFTVTVKGQTATDRSGCPLFFSGPIYLFAQEQSAAHPVLLGSVTLPTVTPCSLAPGTPNTVTRQITTAALVTPPVPNVRVEITAEYAGDSTYQGSYAQIGHTVSGPGAVTVRVTTDFASIQGGVPFIVHLAATPQAPSTVTPTGTMTLTATDNQGVVTQLGTVTLDANGKANVPIALLNSATITASYKGDANYPAASSTTNMNLTP